MHIYIYISMYMCMYMTGLIRDPVGVSGYRILLGSGGLSKGLGFYSLEGMGSGRLSKQVSNPYDPNSNHTYPRS